MKTKHLSTRIVAIVLSVLLVLGTGVAGLTALAAAKVTVKIANIPRDSDNQSSNTNWGHPELKLMNGWVVKKETWFTVKVLDDYETGNVAYCVEPAASLHTEDTLTDRGSVTDYFQDLPYNGTLNGNWQRKLIAAILNKGYQGKTSLTNWVTQNASGRAQLAEYWATQLLVWEAIVGERDPDFNRLPVPSGYVSVDDFVMSGNPIRSDILSAMSRLEKEVRAELLCPSFMEQDDRLQKTYTLQYDSASKQYKTTLTDTNSVLSKWDFYAKGVTSTKSGNTLTLTSDEPLTGEVQLWTSRDVPTSGMVVYGDGTFNKTGSGMQDLVAYGADTNEKFYAYAKLKTAGTPEPTTQSTTQSTTKSTTQSTTQSTTKPTTQSTTQSTTKPTTQSTTQSTTKSTTQSTTQSTTKPTTQSTTQSTTKSTTQSTTQPTTKSTTQSTTQSTTKPTTQSTTQSTTKSTTQSTTQSTTRPVVVTEPTTAPTTRTVPTSSTTLPTTSTTARTTTRATTRTTTRPTTRKTEPVNTGDESKPVVWILVAALAATAMALLFFLRREQQEKS